MAKKRNDGLQDKVDSNEQANQRKVATALKYNRGVDDVPKLVAKGWDLLLKILLRPGKNTIFQSIRMRGCLNSFTIWHWVKKYHLNFMKSLQKSWSL